MRHFQFVVVVLMSAVFLLQCDKGEDPINTEVNVPTGTGHALLSEYNFFVGDLSNLHPNEEAGVIPYDLNMPLFSDYALKKRFIYVPDGSVIPYDTTDVLQAPLGSVLIKHFYYPTGNGDFKYIETRLLIHQSNGWRAETYQWNESQTDASRTVVGGTQNLTLPINGQSENFNYLIPNTNQCANCHNNDGHIDLIGPRIHNLNKEYDYESGTANQIDTWISKGILANNSSGYVPSWPQIADVSTSLNDRARAYLAVNCSSCHRQEGSAANSGLYLEYSNNDSLSLGFYKTPVAAGAGSGGFTHVIEPGQADQSILLFRMSSNDVDARMPEIGRDIAHEEGIELIREWINSL